MSTGAHRRRWVGWAVLAVVVAALLGVGLARDDGASTPQERADAISKRIACPVCDGESVFESRNNASESIRAAIAQRVNAGGQSDDEIVAFIESRFGGRVLLVPRGSGIDALVWALPAGALVLALVALTLAFRRWQADEPRAPSEEDRRLVAVAMDHDDRDGKE